MNTNTSLIIGVVTRDGMSYKMNTLLLIDSRNHASLTAYASVGFCYNVNTGLP
jgi:hypothetical protein